MARLLALDVGERRIGVAISDPTQTLARPLTAIVCASGQADFAAIAALVDEYEAECVVVGLPLSLDGTEGPQAQQTRRYAERLAQVLIVPVELWDESYSTVDATEILSKKRKRKRPRRSRGEIDSVAAAVFLQSFLDARSSRNTQGVDTL